MLDHFHRRLRVVERDLERMIAAPTFPIYDTSNLPDDVISGQVIIGTDGSINWRDLNTWYAHLGGSVAGNPPDDAIDGQIVIGSDNSLCWKVNDSWYGAAGVELSGNPPQDAVTGQLAIAPNTLAWHVNGIWYGFVETPITNFRLLRVKVTDYSLDDFTPALYNRFDIAYVDVWARVTLRKDISPTSLAFPLFVLGWTEWVNDQAYFGDWWRTGGISLWDPGSTVSRPAQIWNVSTHTAGTETYSAPTNTPTARVWDLHAQFMEDIVDFGVTYSKWLIEAYLNDDLKYSRWFTITGDSHQRTFHSIQALVIFNQYGNSGIPYLYMDDISVGTGRGLTDIMTVQDFEDGTFNAFSVDFGDLGSMQESFAVVLDPNL